MKIMHPVKGWGWGEEGMAAGGEAAFIVITRRGPQWARIIVL